jgi:GMP synthase (glutamine-hydrolysing)
MHILILDNESSFIHDLEHLCYPHHITTLHPELISNTDISKYDLIIISGGHRVSVARHQPFYQKQLDLIQYSRVPILGICLGCELIAQSYDCTLERLEERVIGLIDIDKTLEDPIFSGITKMNVFESHLWAVRQLSSEVTGLATSQSGYEIIKHNTKLQYGFQFHPEYTKEPNSGQKLFENFLHLCSNVF